MSSWDGVAVASKLMISDLQAGQTVHSWFLITDCSVKTSQNGNDYLELRLADITGDIVMRIWGTSEAMAQRFAPGKIVKVTGLSVSEFKGRRQFAVDASQVSRLFDVDDPTGYDMKLLLPCAFRDLDKLLDTLMTDIESVSDPVIRGFLVAIVLDDGFIDKFRVWPAAIRHHHAYMGGLLEHTVGVMQSCKAAASFYPSANGDLLVAGALLHDVGKLATYDYDMTSGVIKMTKQGVLQDHIPLGVDMLKQFVSKFVSEDTDLGSGWCEEYTVNLEHMILSHHGKKEWGSPVEPATIEALILHHADNLDSQVNKLERYIGSGAVKSGEFSFLDDVRLSLYLGDWRHLEREQEAEREVDIAANKEEAG